MPHFGEFIQNWPRIRKWTDFNCWTSTWSLRSFSLVVGHFLPKRTLGAVVDFSHCIFMYTSLFIKEPHTVVHLLFSFTSIQVLKVLQQPSTNIVCVERDSRMSFLTSLSMSMSGIRVICVMDFILCTCHMNTPWCCTDAGVKVCVFRQRDDAKGWP